MITLAASLFDLSGTHGAMEIAEALFLVAIALVGTLGLFRHLRDKLP